MDLEMSGLDVASCRILEVAALITDQSLRPLEEYSAIVYQEPSVLAAMDAWCTEHHGKSGLTAAVANGKKEALVEEELLAFIDRSFEANEKIILCGNSIGQDRKFVEAYWPKLAAKLHYRMLDVTSFKVVFQNTLGKKFEKSGAHRALGDIHESIAELKYYLSFVKP